MFKTLPLDFLSFSLLFSKCGFLYNFLFFFFSTYDSPFSKNQKISFFRQQQENLPEKKNTSVLQKWGTFFAIFCESRTKNKTENKKFERPRNVLLVRQTALFQRNNSNKCSKKSNFMDCQKNANHR